MKLDFRRVSFGATVLSILGNLEAMDSDYSYNQQSSDAAPYVQNNEEEQEPEPVAQVISEVDLEAVKEAYAGYLQQIGSGKKFNMKLANLLLPDSLGEYSANYGEIPIINLYEANVWENAQRCLNEMGEEDIMSGLSEIGGYYSELHSFGLSDRDIFTFVLVQNTLLGFAPCLNFQGNEEVNRILRLWRVCSLTKESDKVIAVTLR